MLISWMKTNNSTKWSDGLPSVQFSKNRSFHKGIGRSPYEAMFGSKAKVGISSTDLPQEVVATIETEEQLEEALHALFGQSSAAKEFDISSAEASSMVAENGLQDSEVASASSNEDSSILMV